MPWVTGRTPRIMIWFVKQKMAKFENFLATFPLFFPGKNHFWHHLSPLFRNLDVFQLYPCLFPSYTTRTVVGNKKYLLQWVCPCLHEYFPGKKYFHEYFSLTFPSKNLKFKFTGLWSEKERLEQQRKKNIQKPKKVLSNIFLLTRTTQIVQSKLIRYTKNETTALTCCN